MTGPAGWFQPADGEAAPPFRHGMEPARSDEDPDPGDPLREGGWPWTFPGQPGNIPVAGPAQALSASEGVPGTAAQPGAVPGPPGHGQQSGWQLAQQAWQGAGIRWEPAAPGPGSSPGSAPRPGRDSSQDPSPGPGEGFSRSPGSYFGFPVGQGFAPGQGLPADEGSYPDFTPGDGFDSASGSYPDFTPGDGFDSASGPSPRFIPGARGSGPEGDGPDASGSDEDGPDTTWRVLSAEFPPGAGRWPAQGDPEPPAPAYQEPAWRGQLDTGLAGQQFGEAPLGAPVADAPSGADRVTGRAGDGRRGSPPPLPVRGEGTGVLSDPDELFEAWQGSVRRAAARRGNWFVRRYGRRVARRRVWQAITIGVPAAVIVAVGVVALMMLTGRANEMLAVQANSGTRSPATARGGSPGAASAASSGVRVTTASLAGYPGGSGAVTVAAMRTEAGVSVAVGGADGHPAIWQLVNGDWRLESASVLGAIPGTGSLTSVTHGPDGWLAVGSTTEAATTSTLVVTSADGVTWQPVASLENRAVPGVTFIGTAGGPGGYVVVGKREVHGRTFAVLWWSPDLRTWTADGNGHLDGRIIPSTARASAATTGTGFVTVGPHGPYQAIWTSPDGKHWSLHNITVRPGTRSASLSVVAVTGTRIVAGGDAVTPVGEIPAVEVSADGGAHWRPVVLPAPGGSGMVTALTAVGGGFVAAGVTGPASARQTVIWTSHDGTTWSAATPVPSGTGEITALNSTGTTITGTARQGNSTSVLALRLP